MKLQRAIAGQQAQTEVFYNVTLDSPPVYRVVDFNGNLVLKGAGAQDPVNTKRWTAQILIPTTAPIGRPDQLYSIEWTGKFGPSRYVQTDSFSVGTRSDFAPEYEERVLLSGRNFSDTLVINDPAPVSNLSVKLYNPAADLPIYEAAISNVPISFDGHTQTFSHRSPTPLSDMAVPSNDYKPYLIQWSWTQGGEEQDEMHYLYVVANKVILLMHNMRRKIDKARVHQRNPALSFNDADLLTYIDQGMQYLNACRPTLTDFSVTNLPSIFDAAILNCASYSALCAQYLAEGQSAFEFSGQTVSLSMDRTQFIDAEINRLSQYMETTLPQTKKQWIMSSGGRNPGYLRMGALGINVGPSLNYNAGQFAYSPALWIRGISF